MLKNKIFSRKLSIFMALIMVLGMFSFSSVYANAAEVDTEPENEVILLNTTDYPISGKTSGNFTGVWSDRAYFKFTANTTYTIWYSYDSGGSGVGNMMIYKGSTAITSSFVESHILRGDGDVYSFTFTPSSSGTYNFLIQALDDGSTKTYGYTVSH